MKTTPEMRKARRKARRAESREKANQGLLALCEILDLPITYRESVGQFCIPPTKVQPTVKLAALLRLGRNLRHMLDCARRELDRRYRDETKRRRRELKKDYKAMVLRQLAEADVPIRMSEKAKAEVEKV